MLHAPSRAPLVPALSRIANVSMAQVRAEAAARRKASLEAKLKAEQEARLQAEKERQHKAAEEARRQAEEAQRKEQMARQAALLKAQQEAEAKQRAQEAETQRWIAMAAQHRAAQAQQTADAWTNIEVQRAQASRPPQMSLADWKQQDMQATDEYLNKLKAAQTASQQQPADAWTQAELQRARNWLWSHPEALAAVLTDNPAGRDYLAKKLPDLINSPTGCAVIEALLAHGQINVGFFPGWPNASIQPWTGTIFMADNTQPAHVFAHEAVHYLARVTGVDPLSIAGDFELWRYRPGFSLQMEREAYILEKTIQFELASGGEKKRLANEIRTLIALDDTEAAFAMVQQYGGGAYDWYPTNNKPVRDWRVDLQQMGFGAEVLQAIVQAAWFSDNQPVEEGLR